MEIGSIASFAVLGGGYLFVQMCHRTRFATNHLSGYHVLFYSAVTGALLMVGTWVLTLLSQILLGEYEWIIESWESLRPFSGVETLVLGPSLAVLVNGFRGKDESYSLSLADGNDSLEGALWSSARFRSNLLEITLTDGVFYAGYVQRGFAGRTRANIELVPIARGYIAKETHEYTLYRGLDLHELVMEEDSDSYEQIVVIPVSQIKTVRQFFKPTVYSAEIIPFEDTWLQEVREAVRLTWLHFKDTWLCDALKIIGIVLGGILLMALIRWGIMDA